MKALDEKCPAKLCETLGMASTSPVFVLVAESYSALKLKIRKCSSEQSAL